MKFLIFPFLLLSFLCFSIHDCNIAYSYKRTSLERAVYNETNDKLAKRYPELSFMLKDPELFLSEMNNRFNLQKQQTPENPYGFDYSEIGMPFIESTLKEIQALENLLDKQANDPKNYKKSIDFTFGYKYLKKLKNELSEFKKQERISYKELLEFSYFYTKFAGIIHHSELSFIESNLLKIDRAIMGYSQGGFEVEYGKYLKNQYEVFSGTANHKNFKESELPFEQDLLDHKKLNLVLIPSHLYFRRDIFNRLLKYEIYIVGAASEPIAADGFQRPPGDFWTHDIYHSSHLRRRKQDRYKSISKDISTNTVRKLDARVDVWMKEFNVELNKIKDKKLKSAVRLVFFNFHHEQGHPILPSSYFNKKQDRIVYLLYTIMRVSGQHLGFRNPLYNLPRAWKWMSKFWLGKLDEERAILASSDFITSSGIKIKGNLTEIIHDDFDKPIYLNYHGATQLEYKGQVLKGQGKQQHPHGFSSPVGNVIENTFDKPLELLTKKQLKEIGVREGHIAELNYQSGIKVTGKIVKIIKKGNKNLIIKFTNATVTSPTGDILFSPVWGEYDMALIGHINKKN